MIRLGGVLMDTYCIERLIAEGSMGSVYQARHVRVPKRYAVKFLKLDLSSNAEALQRFRREAEVVAALTHPNVVQLFDYNVTDDGQPYIVFELLDGESLGARLDRGRLQLAEAVDVAAQAASALGAAHAHEIIHRDLKPENILVTPRGVKVVDFGVAKLRGAPDLTAVNSVVGTLPYMAPEQLRGGKLDARVDQYALAAIVYEMLTGRTAFDPGDELTVTARRVLAELPPPIADVPAAVNEVLFRALAKEADARYATIGDFAAALAEAARAPFEPALGGDEPAPLPGEATRVTPVPPLGGALTPPNGAPATEATVDDLPSAEEALNALDEALLTTEVETLPHETTAPSARVAPPDEAAAAPKPAAATATAIATPPPAIAATPPMAMPAAPAAPPMAMPVATPTATVMPPPMHAAPPSTQTPLPPVKAPLPSMPSVQAAPKPAARPTRAPQAVPAPAAPSLPAQLAVADLEPLPKVQVSATALAELPSPVVESQLTLEVESLYDSTHAVTEVTSLPPVATALVDRAELGPRTSEPRAATAPRRRSSPRAKRPARGDTTERTDIARPRRTSRVLARIRWALVGAAVGVAAVALLMLLLKLWHHEP